MTYQDGTRVDESQYGYYGSLPEAQNAAAPSPHLLTPPFTSGRGMRDIFQFGELHVGGRADHNDQRRFLGRIALLVIYHADLTGTQASCLFNQGEQALPYPSGSTTRFEDATGVFGSGWGQAVDYCILQGAEGLCPLSTYCPDGPGAQPFGGRRTGNQWAPYMAAGKTNKWVQVGTFSSDLRNTCMNHNALLGSVFDDPDWGVDSAEASARTEVGWVMCCTQGTRCMAGEDCGGQVMQQCGTACPNICGQVPLASPIGGRRQLLNGAAAGPTCSSMQRGMVIRCIFGAPTDHLDTSEIGQSPCEQCAGAMSLYRTIVATCVLAIRNNQDTIQPHSLPVEANGMLAMDYIQHVVE